MDGTRRRGVRVDLTFLFDSYPGIDLAETGRHLEELIRKSGISVKKIQDMLHLSCPQPVYRWMKGQMLPTVDHLYALAKLFSIHMEELLVQESGSMGEICFYKEIPCHGRLSAYGGVEDRFPFPQE